MSGSSLTLSSSDALIEDAEVSENEIRASSRHLRIYSDCIIHSNAHLNETKTKTSKAPASELSASTVRRQ
jgi:hypothetical protein